VRNFAINILQVVDTRAANPNAPIVGFDLGGLGHRLAEKRNGTLCRALVFPSGRFGRTRPSRVGLQVCLFNRWAENSAILALVQGSHPYKKAQVKAAANPSGNSATDCSSSGVPRA
jgi:hypothetical protein